jgi:hypothetical protein
VLGGKRSYLKKMSDKKSPAAQLASELTPNSRRCEAENLKKLDQLPNLPKTSAAQNLACKFDSKKISNARSRLTIQS